MNSLDVGADLAIQSSPFVLVARNPSVAGAESRSTTAVRFNSIAAALDWVARAESVGRNIYVVRNRCHGGVLYRRRTDGSRYVSSSWGNPPLTQDIAAIEWLVIDIDPVADTIDSAFAHANALLDRLPVPLHYRMFSGRGLQAAVRIFPPADREDEQAFRSALELGDRINAWLRENADPSINKVDDVTNVNRFSRLCGTINQKTGHTACWIQAPRPEAVIHLPETLLPGTKSTRVRHWQQIEVPEGLDPYVNEAIRDIGRQPTSEEMKKLDQVRRHEGVAPQLSPEFSHRAATGEDWSGRVHPDRSSRIISFASSAHKAGEPIAAIVAALCDPKNEILNEHWLRPKSGRINAWRVVARAMAKAIMTASGPSLDQEHGDETV